MRLLITVGLLLAPGAGLAAQTGGVLGILGASVLLLVLVVGGLVLWMRRSLPQVAGELRLDGLEAAVEVIRDRDGVPHIFADHRADALFGLGFVHAQDRLWQMELQRRTGQGRLAEILGRRVLALDRFMRTLGLARAADRSWTALSADARTAAESYAAGINAFLAGRGPSRLAPECALLRVRPEPWTGGDVVLAGKFLAWGLGGTYVTELLRHELTVALGPERAAQLVPDRVAAGGVTADPGAGRTGTGCAPVGEQLEEGQGSNLWAVAAGLAGASGAVLANDPHLPSNAPMSWYLAHLRAGEDLDVIGATVPGLPAVIAGRNREVAWGITNLSPDVQDLFRERLAEDGQGVEGPDGMVPLTCRTEVLAVRRGPAETLEVREGPHGPLVSEALAGGATRPSIDEPLALAWTGLAEDDTTLDAFLRLWQVRDWQEFREALRPCVAPALNFCYADRLGHVGHQAAGRVPVRRSGDGSLPAEGWTGAGDWESYLPFDELPRSVDPPSGIVVSINGGEPPDGYAHFLGRDWVEPYRERRIREVLEQGGIDDLDGHAALQMDTLSLHAREILPELLTRVEVDGDRRLARAVERLRDWDRRADGSSAAAALFAAWTHHLPEVLLAGDGLAPRLRANYLSWTSYVQRHVADVLAGRTPAPRPVEACVTEALARAVGDLERRLGKDPARWRWDRLHRAVFPHTPFHNLRPLRPLFSRSSPRGGDWSTVNLGTVVPGRPYLQRMIPGYRQVVSLSDPDSGGFIQALGQSGHFLSPRYDDYLEDWERGALRPMRMRRRTVEQAAVARLHLRPAEPAQRSAPSSSSLRRTQ